jgi:hypothetical protein
MKKTNLLLLSSVVLLASVLLLSSCKKDKTEPTPTPEQPAVVAPATTDMANGMPSNKKTLNGYLYAGYEVDYNGLVSTNIFNSFAVFADPARDLAANYDHQKDKITNGGSANVGNVTVGDVSFSGNTLFHSASNTSTDISRLITSANFDYGTRWTTQGTTNFKALDLLVTRGFPLIANQSSVDIVSISQGFTVNLTNFISNSDSVTVRVSNFASKNGFSGIQKTVASSASASIVFTSAELSSVLAANQPGYIFYRAFNYSNKTVENKVYLFELSNKLERKLTVNP